MALPDAGDRARALRIINRLISYGVEVRVMPGHATRGFVFPAVPSRVVDHHDASSRKSGEWGALGLCLDGTPRGIPGPLCNALVARCLDNVPRVAWVADGYAYHAGAGGAYAELRKDNANPYTYGVEKANDGLGEPATEAANYATNALFHAMAVESGRIPESFPIGHKEWAPGRKTDPLYAMADRRRQVGAFVPRGAAPAPAPAPTPVPEEEPMPAFVIYAQDKPPAVLTEGGRFVGLAPNTDEEKNWLAAGAKPVWVMPFTWEAFDAQNHAADRITALLEKLVAQTAPAAPATAPKV